MSISPEASIVISGASQGIGRSIAVILAELLPNPLILIARSADGLAETTKECKLLSSNRIDAFTCDLSNADEVNKLLQKADFDNVAVLVNNAGYFLQKSVLECESEDYSSQFEANTLTAVHITNGLLQRLNNQPEARAVFICSVTAQKGQARCGAYSASKAALNGYIQSLREALLDTKTAVTSIILGQTFSTSWDGSGIDPNRLADPEDVGRVIAGLCGLSSRTCVEEVVIRPQQGDL